VNVLSDINEDNYDRAFSFLRPGSHPLKSNCSRVLLIFNSWCPPPVIQGASEMGTRLSETELQKSLDFCVGLFNPTSPEQHARVARGGFIAQELLDVTAPVMHPAVLESLLKVEKQLGGGGGGVICGGNITGLKLNVIISHASNNGLGSGNGKGYGIRGRSCSESSTSSDGSSDSEKAAETKMVLHKINARRVVHSEYGINNLESEPLNGLVVRLEKGRLGLVKVLASG
jgi:hypothetical protein